MTGRRKNNSVSALTLVSAVNEDETRLGLCGRYPDCLQRFATPKMFLVAFCIKNILQGMVFSYIIGVETSIERHFKFDASTVGLLLTLGEIGPILTAVWISYVGSYGNRPRWMGFGMLIIALSAVFAFSTYWIFPSPPLAASEQLGYTSYANSSVTDHLLCSEYSQDGPTAESANTRKDGSISSSQRRWAFVAWVLIYSLLGIGSTTVYTIGASYLDDSIDNKKSPLYFGITIAVRAVGPVFGISLSSACTRMYVDLSTKPNFQANDPRWIGAWWLGFLVIAVLLTIYAFVLAAFPRRLATNTDKKDAAQAEKGPIATPTSSTLTVTDKAQEEDEDGASKFRKSFWRIIRNPLVICGCASSIFSVLGVVGYVVWLPKYFEHEFRRSKSSAALFSGVAGKLSMIFGVLLSGCLMSRYRPSARTVAAYVALSKFIYALVILLLMFLNCGYENDLPGTLSTNGSLVLSTSCSQDCQCNTEKFSPVCLRGPDGVNQTYFSPCHAGCSQVSTTGNSTSYTNCLCGAHSEVETGFCGSKPCSKMYVYMICLSAVKFIVSLSTVGNLIINFRCVEERDKALCLGILSAAVALLGFLPNPIIFGWAIDSSCLVWERSCGKKGSCWVYANDQFRYRLHGITSACLMLAGVFEVITYFQVKDLKLFETHAKD